MTSVLIQCGDVKRPKPDRAEDLYIGLNFIEQKRAAKRISQNWYILSAKHGLLAPSRIIAPYNERLPVAGDPEWGARVLEAILALGLERERIVVFASESYCVGWADVVNAERPLRGIAGLGNRKKVMRGYS